MEFLTAVKLMKERKKVRRQCWNPGTYIYDAGQGIVWNSGQRPKFSMAQFEAVDWEEFQDNKSLSDKILLAGSLYGISGNTGLLKEEDVKRTIRMFIDWSKHQYGFDGCSDMIDGKSKEIFGDKLM